MNYAIYREYSGHQTRERCKRCFLGACERMIKTDGCIIKIERKVDDSESFVEVTIVMRYDGGTFDYEKLMLGDVEITQKGE